MAGNYQSWGVCRKCGAEVNVTRKYGGLDSGRLGYNCGGCWMRDVAKPILDYARGLETRILKLVLFPRRRRA